MSSQQLVTGMLESFNDRRWSDFVAAYTPDAVISYPQSGERITGRERILGMVQAFPAPPRFTLTDLADGGNVVVAHADVEYAAGPPWKGAFVYLLRGSKVSRETAYFGAPFEPAGWRAAFTGG